MTARAAVLTVTFVLGALAALSLLLATSAEAAPTVVISAHRGGDGQWPENSMLAFSHALAAGYAEIEADAWTTKDGHRVIYHDDRISPTRCPGPLAGRRIHDLTVAEVQTVRCDGQPIPSEWALVHLVLRYPSATLRLEAKHAPGWTSAAVRSNARYIADMVVSYGATRQTIMQDFDWSGIAGFHAAAPTLRASALISHRPSTAEVRKARSLGAYDLSYSARYATATLNRYIVKYHLVPTVWSSDGVPNDLLAPTAGDQATVVQGFCRAVNLGARVVITNYPQLARDALPGCSAAT
jgi:glycerophosphoryl diester phosphodiesterase